MSTDRITLDPAVMSGKPCIRGLRVTAANILRQLANHRTPEQILAAYPYLEAADIDACLSYAALRVELDDRVQHRERCETRSYSHVEVMADFDAAIS